MPSKAAAQIGVTFGRDDLDVLDALNAVSKKSGAPVSHIVRQALRAALFEEHDALDSLKAYRSFSEARLLARASEA